MTAARANRPPSAVAERGAGTVAMIGLALAGLTLMTGLLVFAQALIGSARAATAADLSALAAADAVRGLRSEEPCGLAAQVAERNGADLAGCRLDAAAGTATVSVDVPLPLLGGIGVTGQARAGPPAG